MTTKPTPPSVDPQDLLPVEVARQRTDALLRNLLRRPPDPHVAPKPVKRARKKPSKKK